MKKEDVENLLKRACTDTIGLLPTGFLCQSLGVLNPPEPYIVDHSVSLGEAVTLMRDHKIGCLNISQNADPFAGIFTERDLFLKGFGADPSLPVGQFMTIHPTTASVMDPIAYALNLMSHGGFRHLPLHTEDKKELIGIISVKDIIDYIVSKMTESLMEV